MYNLTYIDNMNYLPAPTVSWVSTVGVFPATEVPVTHCPTKQQQQKHYHFIVSSFDINRTKIYTHSFITFIL